MATLLLMIIYLAFIGLGLPDSLFGTAWPAIYTEFALPFSFGSFVTTVITCGTITSSILSTRVIARFGTGKVTAFSTAMTALALLGFSLSGNLLLLCLLAIPLGLGAGSVDTGLNNYVALHYSSSQMSLLHCFYGIGITVSPYLMARFLTSDAGWRGAYRVSFLIQFLIALILFATLFLWKKAGSEHSQEETPVKVLSIPELAKIPGVKVTWLLFIASCAIESATNSWGSTFLVEHKGFSADQAARVMIFYFLGFTLGRLLSGILATRFSCWKIIRMALAVLGIAMVLLLLPLSNLFVILALFLIGLGNSPMFPNLTYLAPVHFGTDISQSLIGTQVAASNVSFMLAPLLCGLFGQFFGMGIYPIYLALLFLLLAWGIHTIQRTMKAAGKNIQ